MIETIGYDRNHKERQQNDFYATPSEEVENILKHEDLIGTVLEPACGKGHISKMISENKLISTDLIDRGYGICELDFLSDKYPYGDNIDTIITNPPFKLIEEFVNKAIKIARSKVIILARTQFLETISRYENIFINNPPNRIYQYVDRIACAKNADFENTSNSMSYAWFVWDKECNDTRLYWIRRSDKVIKEEL